MFWRDITNSHRQNFDVRINPSGQPQTAPSKKHDVLIEHEELLKAPVHLYDPGSRRSSASMIVEVPRPRHSDAFNPAPVHRPTSSHVHVHRRDERKHLQTHAHRPEERTNYELTASAPDTRSRRQSGVCSMKQGTTTHTTPSPWVRQPQSQQQQQQQRQWQQGRSTRALSSCQIPRSTNLETKMNPDYEGSRRQGRPEHQQQQQQQQQRRPRPARPPLVHRVTPNLPYPTDRQRQTSVRPERAVGKPPRPVMNPWDRHNSHANKKHVHFSASTAG